MSKPQVKIYPPAIGLNMLSYYDVDEMDAFIKRDEKLILLLRNKLNKAEARVAILDAQEVKLPESLEVFLHLHFASDQWIENAKGSALWEVMTALYSQLLDALRAVQAWWGVARRQNQAIVRAERKLRAYVGVCKGDKELTQTILPMLDAAIAAYDALAGKDGE